MDSLADGESRDRPVQRLSGLSLRSLTEGVGSAVIDSSFLYALR